MFTNEITELPNVANTTKSESVIEKLKTLTSSAANRTKTLTEKITPDLSTLDQENYPLLFVRYIFAFLLILFILINILAALNILPDTLLNFFKPILVFFGHNVGETIRQTTNVTAKGVKSATRATSDSINNTLDMLEGDINNRNQHMNQNRNQHRNKDRNQHRNEDRNQHMNNIPIPSDSIENTSIGKTAEKAGFCYVGTDRGHRSCIEVDDQDQCMSGDIFPTRDICVNPNLRQ